MADYILPRGTTTLAGVADTNNVLIGDGDQEVTTGLDQSALAAGLAGFRVGPKASPKIGGPSGYFKVDIDSGAGALIDYNAGGGHLYYRPNGNNNLCHLFYQRGQGKAYIGEGGTVTALHCSSSYTSVNESTIVTNLKIKGGAEVKVGYHATAITAATIDGAANLTCARVMTTCTIYGAGMDKTRVVIRRENFSATNTPVPVTLNVRNATVVLEAAGTVTNLFAYESYIDLSNIPGNLTFTDSDMDAATKKRSRLKSMYGATVTYTNATTYSYAPEDAA